MYIDLVELEDVLLTHCYSMSLLKLSDKQKKKDSILDSLVAAVIRSQTSLDDLKEFMVDVVNDVVLDISLFDRGGNVFGFIKPKWHKLASALWRQRSTGLGTPNAASGEGELMFIFISPLIKKAKKGDLLINGDNFELKGEEVRVSSKVTGKDFRLKTLELCKEYGLTPNTSKSKKGGLNLFAVELEKEPHRSHWVSQLATIDFCSRKSFVSGWLSLIDGFEHNVDSLFISEVLDFDILKKYIVKLLYRCLVSDRNFDKFVILGDGSNVKIFSNDLNLFDDCIDSEKLTIKKDFFRINQDALLGWYVE